VARFTQNGGKIVVTDNTAGTTLNIGVTSVKFNPGKCADIDITTSSSTERTYLKGFGEGRSLEVSALLGSTAGDPTIAELELLKSNCAMDYLEWHIAAGCATATAVKTWDVTLYDFSVDSEIDGAVAVTMMFRLEDYSG
jgi:hypothetical protein